jgi:hypothetical protein
MRSNSPRTRVSPFRLRRTRETVDGVLTESASFSVAKLVFVRGLPSDGFKAPQSLASLGAAEDAFVQRFFDSNYNLKTGDAVAERFQIARGEQQVGTFSRAAIADNLRNNLSSG